MARVFLRETLRLAAVGPGAASGAPGTEPVVPALEPVASIDVQQVRDAASKAAGLPSLSFMDRLERFSGFEAALVLDGGLQRLARAEHALGLLEGELLWNLKHKGSEKLGYPRLTDYALEELGLSRSHTNELVWMHELLRKYPLTAAAYREGTLSRCHVRLLLRHLAPAEERSWVERASSLTVRALEDELKCRPPAEAPEGQAPGVEGSGADVSGRKRRPVNEEIQEEGPPGYPLELPAGPALARLWHDGLELCRKMEGDELSETNCLELVLAEYLSGAPQPWREESGELSSETSGEGGGGVHLIPDGSVPFPQLLREGVRRLEEDMEKSFRGWEDLPWRAITVTLPGEWSEIPSKPHALHRRLYEIKKYRQSLHGYLVRFLGFLRWSSLFRELGFHSLEHYARERLGMSRSAVHAYASLGRHEFRFPSILEALESGKLSFFKAALLPRVAVDDESAREWIAYARSVPALVLREAVQALSLVRWADPYRWREDQGRVPGASSLVTVEPNGRVRLLWGEELSGESAVQTCGRPSEAGAGPSGGEPVQTCGQPAGEGEAQPPGRLADRLRRLLRPRVTGTLRLYLSDELVPLWNDALAACRAVHRLAAAALSRSPGAAGGCAVVEDPSPSECLQVFLADFLVSWGGKEIPREHAILERDGWHCQVPGCSSRRNLHVHHIIFRSHPGSTDEELNLSTLCVSHHLRAVHEGYVTVTGRAPGELSWVLGVGQGEEPVASYKGGYRVYGREPDSFKKWESRVEGAEPRVIDTREGSLLGTVPAAVSVGGPTPYEANGSGVSMEGHRRKGAEPGVLYEEERWNLQAA